ncbi:hypothetical protein DFH08DRAFT_697568 [Mycena albidolilacea]|uniref:Cytokinin riboside 5'-monophosphate phosphoribohydrolase n=1 Tax=Mycena albidolilacea TaxID=1033008 RepID=A0AAD7A3Y0_9AGAR|nr:hypothetical protein DFH08DRAFT_697568 [Mycena albidolilacea]
MASEASSKAVAVYCGSWPGTEKAFTSAAKSLGHALASANRPLVYGGGSKGIMGVVSGAVLEGNGKATGIIPAAMLAAGGEGGGTVDDVRLNEPGREKVENVVVGSMHERKVEMARRAGAFVGLPGGFGTFEEVLEVSTWTQLGIHNKPVVLLNVLGFWDPLRQLINNGVNYGFIKTISKDIIIFVDGPSSHADHETFNWGEAALQAVDGWKRDPGHGLFRWTAGAEGKTDALEAT